MARKRKAAPRRKADSRSITVTSSFDYRWPSGAITHWSDRDLGEHRVKNEVADFAVKGGYAVDGRLEEQSSGASPDTGAVAAVDNSGAADPDRAAGGQPLDPDAE
jgi:hypothetical protein